jgi:hypothetical protein
LGVNRRTIRRMVTRGELERQLRPVEGRRPEPVFSPEDIDRLAAENPFVTDGSQLQPAGPQPLHPSLIQAVILFEKIAGPIFAQNQEALAKVTGLLDAMSKTLPAAPQASPASFKPWMTIQDASLYSGLTEGLLRRQVRRGELFSVRDRQGRKVRKADLDNFAGVRPDSQEQKLSVLRATG